MEKTKNISYRIQRLYQSKGIKGVLQAIFSKTSNFLFKKSCSLWLERVLSLPFNEVIAEVPLDITFDNFNECLSWITKNMDGGYYLKPEIDTAITNRHYFPFVKHEGEIIGYMKIGFDTVYIKDFKKSINFPNGTAFIYDTYVLPKYRNKKIAQMMINEVMKFLKEKGFERILCHIEMWNKSSLAAYERIGFRELKKIRYIKLFGFEFLTANPADL